MARSLRLLSIAGMLAAPAALPAEQPPPATVDLATVVEAAWACRSAPIAFEYAQRNLLENGWSETTPPSEGKPNPIPTGPHTFERDHVVLTLSPFESYRVTCTVTAVLTGAPAWPDLQQAVTARFGREPESGASNEAAWTQIADHRMVVRLDGSSFTATLTPTPPPPMFASLRAAPDAPPAPPAEPAPVSPTGEIAAAAEACVASLGGRGVSQREIQSAGWTDESDRGGAKIYSRGGSNVRIFTTGIGGGQCIVDAYGEQMDGFDAIRDAISARLTARFGTDTTVAAATGDEGDFSRGQGFTVGNRIAILSSERRATGLSIRFTVMSFR